ncbi:hypothetical protein PGT21_035449 [Puccinia graminis f. sp. tritici]|uniref:Uncharacterized protein n=1 Tax=Puccinia graminis f. sp. tritici TaxID=56615 RepID=A0A5B0NQR7_PUCGR|nr:hypothetical protein PGTUg99_036761 [Puccinia graminis f. sp. tritici]KAA1091545.1 hypothetical protein PGT21_035449 [Puccinia graminis f. sp. tritici]
MANKSIEDSSSSQRTIQACFSPRIALFTSEEIDQEICNKNHLTNFASLLRPFEYIDRVSVRHSNYSTTILDSIRLSFFQIDQITKTNNNNNNNNNNESLKELLDQTIFTQPNISNWIQSINHSPSPPPSSPSSAVLPNLIRIKREHEWLVVGATEEESEEYPQPPTPWYIAFLNLLFEHRPLVEYDHTSHPLAAMIVVSTSHPDPLDQFSKLHESTRKDGPGWPSNEWIETGTILRYYLLVHQINHEPDGGKARATGILETVKKIYGLNCALIYINSENTEWLRKKRIVDQDPNFIHENLNQKEDYWSKYQSKAIIDQQHNLGEFISEEDVLGLKVFLREFTLQSLIPHIERCIQQWNDSLAASRKGITGRLFSAGKKYFSKVPGSASSSSTPEHRYNPTTCSYPHQSQEAQTRRLADFSFMLGDYKFASQIYEYLRKDAFSDQAWSYYSSATQMIGLCTLLQSSFSQRSKLDIDLQRFLFDHTVETASVSQLRIVMIYYEMAKAVGNPNLMSSSLIRIATIYNELISGLIYEQVSRIVPPRQAALYIVLAAHRYTFAQQNWLSKICLRQSPQFIGWDRTEDYIDHKMAQMAELDSDWPAAVIRYWNVIRRRIHSGACDEDDEVYVTKFRALYQKSIDVNPSLELPRIDDISLFDVERCKIRVPHQNHLQAYPDVDSSIWEQLASRCPGSPDFVDTRKELNTAVVNEPFYLDLFLQNPLKTSIKVTHLDIKVANSDTPVNSDDDLLSNLEITPIEDLELLPLETREISVKLLCKRASMNIEITHVKFRFDSLVDCSQKLKKKGKRLQATLIQRLGRVYTNDQSMQVRVRDEIPILEIVGSENLPTTIYDGESLISRISIRNSGQVGLKDLRSVISHTSFFRFCSDSQSTTETSVLYEKSSDDSSEQMILETPNHLLPESPALLAQDLKEGETIEASIVCRGEGVGQHTTCWVFVFRHATSGEILSFRHVQYLTVLPSLSIKPVIRPSLTPDPFYLLTLELDCQDLSEDIEIYQVSTISTHWSCKWINCNPGSSGLLQLPKGSSSVNLAFEVHPRHDSRDDPTMITMLEQLKKLLKKEELVSDEIAKSSVRSHVSLTHPTTEPSVRIGAPTLLSTVLTSRRSARRKALEGYFTSLTGPEIESIFPLTTSRSMEMLVFWRSKEESGKVLQGHHSLPELSFGATLDLVRDTLEIVKDKAGGMYQQTQLQQKLLVAQFQNSEFGSSQDPLAVELSTSQSFIEWDFENKGPLTIPVTFTIKNLSTSASAWYELRLERGDMETRASPQNAPSTGPVFSSSTPHENHMASTNWVGQLNHSGALEPLQKRQIVAACWVFGPAIVDLGNWTCRASYRPLLLDADGQNLRVIEKKPAWIRNGSSRVVHVSSLSSSDAFSS